MENKFKKGLILGGLLGVASLVGLAIKKFRTQDLTEEMQSDLKDLSKKLKKKLSEMEDITKEEFTKMVNAVVDEYSNKKTMAEEAKNLLMAVLLDKWQEMEEAYKAEKGE